METLPLSFCENERNKSAVASMILGPEGPADNGFGPIPWKNEYHNFSYLNPENIIIAEIII